MIKINIIIMLMIVTFSANAEISKNIAAAVANKARPEADVERDDNRKPAEVLSFFGIEPGMKVLDVFAGGGYYTEIVSYLVGPKGKVTLYNNGSWADYVKDEVALRLKGNRLPNVEKLTVEADELNPTENTYDAALFILGFHDLYYVDPKYGWPKIDAPRFLNAIYLSLKPGGIVGIVDHNASTGSPVSSAQDLHRIDPTIIKKGMAQAGFTLVSTSDILQNPSDTLQNSMSDPGIKGKTDRSVMLFRK